MVGSTFQQFYLRELENFVMDNSDIAVNSVSGSTDSRPGLVQCTSVFQASVGLIPKRFKVHC